MAVKVGRIQRGTVIDHITAGKGVKVIEALDLPESERIVSLLMNVESKKFGKKDIVKVEGVHFDPKDVSSKISPFAPKATINWIKDSKVVNKVRLESL